MNEKLTTLLQDEAFVEKLIAQENDTDVQALLKENNIELSLEEIALIKKKVDARLSSGSDELSDDDLENVAGGADVGSIISGVADALCKIGDSVHKWTRSRW